MRTVPNNTLERNSGAQSAVEAGRWWPEARFSNVPADPAPITALRQDLAPCTNFRTIISKKPSTAYSTDPILSARALTDNISKMAPVYKFALIQMQPKVS